MIKIEIIKLINSIIESGDYQGGKEKIMEIFERDNYRNYFVKKMPKFFNDLNEINFILDMLIKVEDFYNGPYLVFEILKESVSAKNNNFIINFLRENYKFFEQKKRLKEDSLDLVITILNKVIKEDNEQADKILEIVKIITKKAIKINKQGLRDLRVGRDYEKQLIAELLEHISNIYFEKKNNKRIEELVRLIKDNFNLVDDDSRMEMYTPNKIFGILKKYIDLDFENNFEKIIELIVKQYQTIWSMDFDGWEFVGGGISQSGNNFFVPDRHFNEYALKPAIEFYYENNEDKNKAWEFIRSLCYTKEKDVSRERPDFLCRAIIPLLFKRCIDYKDTFDGFEALDILEEFIKMRKGIPHKTDLIYQYIYNNTNKFQDDEKWNFVQISFNTPWNKNQSAINIFVKKIISDLAENNYKDALAWIERSIKGEELMPDKHYWESGMIETISKFLNSGDENKKEKGIEMLHEFVKAEKFYNKFDRFEVFSVAELLTRVFDINFNKGLSIVNEVYDNHKLTMNQQILITSGINRVKEATGKKKIFYEFLIKIFKEMGEIKNENEIKNEIAKKISKQLLNRFDHDYAREAIVELGAALAKAKYFKEAIIIARIFINDLDPRIDDKEFNYHEKIKNGEEGGSTISISTVRGWVCWMLSHIPVLGGQDYIKEIVKMVKELSRDENYYIRYMATFPLMQLVRIRHTVTEAGTTNRFITKELAAEIEDIAFAMLRSEENRNLRAVMSGITRVFSYIRSLDTKKAVEVLNYFKEVEDGEALQNIVSLFIFFAEFRKNAFTDGIWEDEYFSYLKDFDDNKIKSLLEEILRSGNEKIRESFAWKFSVLTDEGKTAESKKEYFNISLKYLKMLLEDYSPKIYDDIHRFIDNNISERYEECVDLFKTTIEKEKIALENFPVDHEYQHTSWRGYYYFDKIFDEMFKQNKNDFLDNFELIMKLPPSGFLTRHLMSIAGYFSRFENEKERINKIFNYLIEKVSPNFYDLKVEWEKKNL